MNKKAKGSDFDDEDIELSEENTDPSIRTDKTGMSPIIDGRRNHEADVDDEQEEPSQSLIDKIKSVFKKNNGPEKSSRKISPLLTTLIVLMVGVLFWEDFFPPEPEPVVQLKPRPDKIKPISSTAETPTEATAETPIEATVESPTEATAETPTEATAETPTEATVESPTESTAETPTEATAETPTEATAETPTEATAETPAETTAETPTETVTEAPAESPIEAPADAAAQAPSETPTETPSEPVDSPVSSVDSVDGEAPPSENGDLTDKILEDLEKQVKKDQQREPKKEYVSPPDYEYRGRGLVYNCTGKHWACVDAPSYRTCEDNFSSVNYQKKKIECFPFNVYENQRGCESMQNRVVSSNAKTGFCTGN